MTTLETLPVASDHLPRRPCRDLAHLPGPPGNRLTGNLSRLLPDPGPFLIQQRRQHGACFTVGLLRNARVVILMGPAANEFVLLDGQQSFSSRLGWDTVLDYFGRNVLVRDFEDHRRHRAILAPMFKPNALAGYLAEMQGTIEAEAGTLGSTVDIYRFCKRVTLRIALQTMAGIAPHAQDEGYYDDLVAVLDGVLAPKSPLPWSRHALGRRARDRLRLRLSKLVPERRAASDCSVLTRLARYADASGRTLRDRDVVDHLFGLLFAAHDTTATTLALMLTALADHHDWQAMLREEADGLAASASPLSLEALRGLRATDAVFRETLRLHAPVQLIPRRTVHDLEFCGQRIPANAPVLLVPQGTHYDERYFPEPHAFRPQRFLSGDPVAPFAFVPFGRGSHMCLGKHFAGMEVAAVCAALLHRYSIRPGGNACKLEYVPIVRPTRPLTLRLEPVAGR